MPSPAAKTRLLSTVTPPRIAPLDATVREDGRIVLVRWRGTLPAKFATPDFGPGKTERLVATLNTGSSVNLELIGSYCEVDDNPKPFFSQSPLTSGGTLAVGSYHVAYVIKNGSTVVAISDVATFLQQSGYVNILNGIDGFAVPYGMTCDIYLSQPNSDLSSMRLYRSAVAAATQNFNLDTNTWADLTVKFPGRSKITWTGVFLIPSASLVTNGTTGITIAVPDGILRDPFGMRSAAATKLAVTNQSLVGSNGFAATFPRGTGGFTIYVSWTHGNDSNTTAQAQVSSTPWKSLNKAMAFQKSVANNMNGTGCRIALLRGDTWDVSDASNTNTTGVAIYCSGQDAAHPFVIDSYWDATFGTDPGTRPIITKSSTTGVLLQGGLQVNSTSLVPQWVVVSGLAFTKPTPGVLEQANFTFGFRNFLFSDCLSQGLMWTVQTTGAPTTANGPTYPYYHLENFVFLRCLVMDSIQTGTSHTQGLYCQGHKNLLFSQCFIDNNGYGNSPTQSDIFSHNMYIQYDSWPSVFWGGWSCRGGSHGLQLRCGGAIAYSVFSGNAIHGTLYSQPGGTIYKVFCQKGRDITGAPRGLGWSLNMQFENARNIATSLNCPHGGGIMDTVITVNAQTTDTSPEAASMYLDPQIVTTLVFRNLVMYSHGEMRLTGAVNPQTVLVVNNCIVDTAGVALIAANIPGPSVLLATNNKYHTTLTGTAQVSNNSVSQSFATWQAGSLDSGSLTKTITYPNNAADLGTYYSTIGGTTSETDWYTAMRSRGQNVWTPALHDPSGAIAYMATQYAGV